MTALALIITDAGRQAIIDETNGATLPVTISEVAYGDGTWTPDETATALNNEVKRITSLGSNQATAPDTISVTATDVSADSYTVREIGLYTDTGILFAIYAQATPILTKSAGAASLATFDLILDSVPAGSVTVGDTNFDYPPASTAVKGVVELSTAAEMNTGTDPDRVPSVKEAADYIGRELPAAHYYTDGGTANTYVLSKTGNKKAPTSYQDGAVFEYIAANPNTGASTVNVAGLGVKNIKLKGGANPAAGEIRGRTRLRYDAANDWMELDRSGRIKQTVVIVSNAAWTPQPDTKMIRFTVVGGGGGGGGVAGSGSGTCAIATGGGAGSTSIKTTKAVAASYNITIGAGGAGGAPGANNGIDGGSSVVVGGDVNIAAGGGFGGRGSTGGTIIFLPGGVGGLATGGDINLRGGYASAGVVNGGNPASSSLSGPSIFGGSVYQSSANAVGVASNTIGVGGGGATVLDSSTTRGGGNGADGIVIIEEFF